MKEFNETEVAALDAAKKIIDGLLDPLDKEERNLLLKMLLKMLN